MRVYVRTKVRTVAIRADASQLLRASSFNIHLFHQSNMKLQLPCAIAALGVALLPFASAVDFRILVQFSPDEYASGDDFCTAWLSTWWVWHFLCFLLAPPHILSLCCMEITDIITYHWNSVYSRAYQPHNTNLFYAGSLCRPGDYSGNNVNTEALVTCVFEKSVADGVVHELGITHI